MITREERLAQVRDEARRVLAEFGAEDPRKLDIHRLAAAHNAEIVFSDLDGATAQILHVAGRARIYVSNRISDAGSHRFSILHEIAHLRLGHVLRRGDFERIARACTPEGAAGTSHEREASVLAAEVLMPEPYVRPFCSPRSVSLAQARQISTGCMTSVLASALRFVELTAEACAVVYSEGGRVRWVRRNSAFTPFIPKNRRLHHSSVAFEYFDRGEMDGAAREIAAETWFPRETKDRPGVRMIEHAMCVPALGTAFSLLWLPSAEAAQLARVDDETKESSLAV